MLMNIMEKKYRLLHSKKMKKVISWWMKSNKWQNHFKIWLEIWRKRKKVSKWLRMILWSKTNQSIWRNLKNFWFPKTWIAWYLEISEIRFRKGRVSNLAILIEMNMGMKLIYPRSPNQQWKVQNSKDMMRMINWKINRKNKIVVEDVGTEKWSKFQPKKMIKKTKRSL